MVLKDILSISGESGLFRFVAQGKNAIIVEHLETKKRSTAFASAKVSSLDEISVFTEEEDIALSEIFDVIYEKENGSNTIDYKSDPEKLKTWFSGIVPDYDKERVYVSDIRKIANWYNILQSLDLLVKETPEEEQTVEEDDAELTNKSSGETATVKKREASSEKKAEVEKDGSASATGKTKKIK
ncbi:MAG: DUF5606 domain-containing protein [Bacteroidetes bacterium]|jgi:hypothetical protein|nr:DUF5606 domain-containing protein [Bacteroidota bacterium]